MKKISIILAIIFICLILFQTAFAAKWGLEFLSGTNLPQATPGEFIARVVSYVMGFVGVVLIVVLIYGGFMYMTSRGNEKQTESAKNILTYAIVGIVIIFASYIIARFVISALTVGTTPTPAETPTTPTAPTTPTTPTP